MHQVLPLATRKRRTIRPSTPSAATPRRKPKPTKDRTIDAQNAFLQRLLTPPPFYPPVEIPAHLLQRVEDCGRRERLVLWWLTYKLPVEREAVMVRYADDFVVLCRKGQGAEVYRRLKLWLERRKLKLNEEKTRVVNFEEDGLEFLGFQLSWRKGSSGRK